MVIYVCLKFSSHPFVIGHISCICPGLLSYLATQVFLLTCTLLPNSSTIASQAWYHELSLSPSLMKPQQGVYFQERDWYKDSEFRPGLESRDHFVGEKCGWESKLCHAIFLWGLQNTYNLNFVENDLFMIPGKAHWCIDFSSNSLFI